MAADRTIHLGLIFVIVLAAGCSTNRSAVDAHEACMLNPREWSKIDAPSNRAELMALRPNNIMENTVQQHLHPSSTDVEAWLRKANGDLSVCVYDPTASACGTGNARAVEFQSTASGFTARIALEVVCTGD